MLFINSHSCGGFPTYGYPNRHHPFLRRDVPLENPAIQRDTSMLCADLDVWLTTIRGIGKSAGAGGAILVLSAPRHGERSKGSKKVPESGIQSAWVLNGRSHENLDDWRVPL